MASCPTVSKQGRPYPTIHGPGLQKGIISGGSLALDPKHQYNNRGRNQEQSMSHSVSENEQSATFRQDVRMARKGTQSPLLLANAIAGRYGRLPQVEAVALAGSQASGTADPGSDVDLLVEIALKQCKQVPAGMMQQVSELIASTQNTHWGHTQTPHPIWGGTHRTTGRPWRNLLLGLAPPRARRTHARPARTHRGGRGPRVCAPGGRPDAPTTRPPGQMPRLLARSHLPAPRSPTARQRTHLITQHATRFTLHVSRFTYGPPSALWGVCVAIWKGV